MLICYSFSREISEEESLIDQKMWEKDSVGTNVFLASDKEKLHDFS